MVSILIALLTSSSLSSIKGFKKLYILPTIFLCACGSIVCIGWPWITSTAVGGGIRAHSSLEYLRYIAVNCVKSGILFLLKFCNSFSLKKFKSLRRWGKYFSGYNSDLTEDDFKTPIMKIYNFLKPLFDYDGDDVRRAIRILGIIDYIGSKAETIFPYMYGAWYY